MAVMFMDGFDYYEAGNILQKWTNFIGANSASCNPAYARGVGQGLLITNGSARGYWKTTSSTDSTWTVGCALYFVTSLPTNTNPTLMILDNGTEQVSVRGDGAGHLTVCRGTTVLATSTNVIDANTWYYVELKATINGTTGVIELRVNGSSTGWVPSTSGLNTQRSVNAYATGVGIESWSANSTYFDDLYALDSTGSANTSFLGDVRVVTIRPAGAGNYAQWTSNGYANFGSVNDDPWNDGDATFNQSSTVNQIDSFPFDDMPIGTGSIFAIQHSIIAKRDTGSARSIAAFQRSSGTDYVGTTQVLTTSYLLYTEVKDTNPAGGSWDITSINGAEFGYKLIA